MHPTEKMLLRNHSSATALMGFLLFSLTCFGCARNRTMDTVVKGLGADGYAIWYPAESGIAPGEIWLYDGTLRAKFAERPDTLAMNGPRPTYFEILDTPANAESSLSTTFTAATLSKAGPFAAELNAGTVKSGRIEFSAPQTASIDLGQSLLSNPGRFGTGYAKAMEMVRADTPGLVLIAAVVCVPEVKYTLYCEDPFKLIARIPRIQQAVHARIDAEVQDEHYLRMTLTPVQGLLTLGLTPVRGLRLGMSTDEARRAVGHDLFVAQKQSYALWMPVPLNVPEQQQPIVAKDDSSEEVVSKYHQAIGAIPTTMPTTEPSGRVVEPSNRSTTEPASRVVVPSVGSSTGDGATDRPVEQPPRPVVRPREPVAAESSVPHGVQFMPAPRPPHAPAKQDSEPPASEPAAPRSPDLQ